MTKWAQSGLELMNGSWGEFDSRALLKHSVEAVPINCILSPLPVATL